MRRGPAGVFERDRPHHVEVEAIALGEIEAFFADKDVELSGQQQNLLGVGAPSPWAVGYPGVGEQIHDDDLDAAAGAARRSVPAAVAGFGITPYRLLAFARQPFRRAVGKADD